MKTKIYVWIAGCALIVFSAVMDAPSVWINMVICLAGVVMLSYEGKGNGPRPA